MEKNQRREAVQNNKVPPASPNYSISDDGAACSPLSSPLSDPVSSSLRSPSSASNSPAPPPPPPHRTKLQFQRKGTSLVYRIREHVRLGGPRFSETVKGKLSLMKRGGREKIFRDVFGLGEGEKLLKASQCYLSTTAGPVAGNLFISTHRVGFLSERSLTLHHSSSSGAAAAINFAAPYKLCIPVGKIKGAYESENINNPSQKYIEIVTEDEFEFWFMGFLRYEIALANLRTALSHSTTS